MAAIKGVFGDAKAWIITFERRSKKRSAAVAVERIMSGTTASVGAFATCPAATRACIWSSRYVGSNARAAAR